MGSPQSERVYQKCMQDCNTSTVSPAVATMRLMKTSSSRPTKPLEGLDGRIVEDCLNHWIGRFAADVPKEAPVRMEDDDITSNGCPASWHTLSGTMMAAHACDCRKSVVLRRMPEHCWLQGRGYINTCAPSEGVGDLFSYKAVTDVKGGKHGQ